MLTFKQHTERNLHESMSVGDDAAKGLMKVQRRFQAARRSDETKTRVKRTEAGVRAIINALIARMQCGTKL